MKKEVKVKITFTEGYEERFTKACIEVAQRRIERQEKAAFAEKEEKAAAV